MREIETKLQFTGKDENYVKDTLKAVVWTEPYSQYDRIFLDRSMTKYKIVPGTKICRIRREISPEGIEGYSWTMKVQQEVALDSKEHETGITDPNAAIAMLDEFGFDEFVAVDKTRMKAKADPYNLCLDSVLHLGSFLEIELLTDDDVDAEQVQSEMIAWAEAQGLEGFTICTIPYDTQVYNVMQGR